MAAGFQQAMARTKREVLPEVAGPPGHQLQAERPEGDALQDAVQRGGERLRRAPPRPARRRRLQHAHPPGRCVPLPNCLSILYLTVFGKISMEEKY